MVRLLVKDMAPHLVNRATVRHHPVSMGTHKVLLLGSTTDNLKALLLDNSMEARLPETMAHPADTMAVLLPGNISHLELISKFSKAHPHSLAPATFLVRYQT